MLQEEGDSGGAEAKADGLDVKEEAEKEAVREEKPEPKKVIFSSVT